MAKLTKKELSNHNKALEFLTQEHMSWEDKDFVYNNWNEGANHTNSAFGAFFTPLDLAYDFAIDVGGHRVIDLCAGIGALSYAYWNRCAYEEVKPEIICVELNPDYVEVGKKLLPEATWICADALDVLDLGLGKFDTAISNPPFGNIKRTKNSPNYTGKDFEYHIIDIASEIAEYGVFIVPQMSAGFNYSGRNFYERQKSGRAYDFQKKMNMHFEAGCGVDTFFYKDSWKGVSPICEIVCIEFEQDFIG